MFRCIKTRLQFVGSLGPIPLARCYLRVATPLSIGLQTPTIYLPNKVDHALIRERRFEKGYFDIRHVGMTVEPCRNARYGRVVLGWFDEDR